MFELGIKIALFQGADNNAGDYLIVMRTKLLLKHLYPDCEIIEYFRNNSLEPYLQEINKCNIGIFAGGPAYFSLFYPKQAPLVENLESITIPLMCVGVGWYGMDSMPYIVYDDIFQGKQLKLLQRISKDSKIFGCRDFLSAHVLRNNGFNNVLMTGCPAWYDLENIDKLTYEGPGIRNLKKICISDCGRLDNLAQMVDVINFGAEFFGSEKDVYFVAHKSINEEIKPDLLNMLKERNIEFVDISGSCEGLKIYDDCDLHIGFRVHAHIYNLSKRNASILVEEDARGTGVNNALGLPNISVSTRVINGIDLSNIVNENISLQLKDTLLDYESCKYAQLENAYRLMRTYFENMKRHLMLIKDIV